MKLQDLIEKLNEIEDNNADVFVSSDAEGNDRSLIDDIEESWYHNGEPAVCEICDEYYDHCEHVPPDDQHGKKVVIIWRV